MFIGHRNCQMAKTVYFCCCHHFQRNYEQCLSFATYVALKVSMPYFTSDAYGLYSCVMAALMINSKSLPGFLKKTFVKIKLINLSLKQITSILIHEEERLSFFIMHKFYNCTQLVCRILYIFT